MKLITSQQLYSYSQESEIKLFNDKHESLKQREVVIVTDIIGYEINSRPLINAVHEDILDQLNENPQVKIHLEHLINQLFIELDEVLVDSELDLVAYEAQLKDLLKFFNVSINAQSHSINERVYDIVQVVKFLKGKKLLIFVNSLSYLTDDEIKRLVEYISCSGVSTLFVEPRKFEGIEQYIVDSDYFVYKFE